MATTVVSDIVSEILAHVANGDHRCCVQLHSPAGLAMGSYVQQGRRYYYVTRQSQHETQLQSTDGELVAQLFLAAVSVSAAAADTIGVHVNGMRLCSVHASRIESSMVQRLLCL